jgi:chromosome segregation ATPase
VDRSITAQEIGALREEVASLRARLAEAEEKLKERQTYNRRLDKAFDKLSNYCKSQRQRAEKAERERDEAVGKLDEIEAYANKIRDFGDVYDGFARYCGDCVCRVRAKLFVMLGKKPTPKGADGE